VAATAAITLAIGVTGAALGGYLGPRAQAPAQAQPVERAKPSVVLVPVTNQPSAEQPQAVPIPDEGTPVFAEYRRGARGEDEDGFEREHEGRRHRPHHEHERDDDDD